MIDDNSAIYRIVTFDKSHNWEALIKQTDDFLNGNGLYYLKQLLDKVTKTVIVEKQYIDKDYRDTFSNFHSRRFVTPESRCCRLHFFSDVVTRDDLAESDKGKLQPCYLGYSIIRPTRPNCIGRTLVYPQCRKNSGYLIMCKEKVLLRNVELSIEGFPFISQDGDATVCAESTLWMVMRYFSNKYNTYKERFPFEITKLSENHAFGSRVYPSGGLSIWQISESLRSVGFSTLVYGCGTAKSGGESRLEFKKRRNNFYHKMSTYIESGLPIIVSVPSHVVVGMGHQMELPTVLNGKRTYTSQFYSGLIIHDDNIPAYQLLEKQRVNSKPVLKYFRKQRVDSEPWSTSKYTFEDIDAFVVPLAEKIFMKTEDFEAVVTTLLEGDEFGLSKSPSLQNENIIKRIFLTSGQSFKRNLPDRGNMGNDIVHHFYSEIPLPHFIWVCELSTLDEYIKDNVLGEIIWDATRNAYEPHGFISIHYPEIMWFDSGAPFNQNQEIQEVELNNSKPYLFYQSNLKEF